MTIQELVSQRRAFAVLGVLAAALAVGLSTAKAGPKATVTLRVLQASEFTNGQNLLILNFERVYPNIHVDVTYVTGATAFQTLLPQLQAGNAPDVFVVTTGNTSPGSVWPLANQGYLLDLSGSPWVKRVVSRMRDLISFRKNVSQPKKVYAWPQAVGVPGIVYNVTLLNQLGLSAV